ncbi:hypothetical protein TNCT6_68220 [Streptomyces sp. 6-11-2]|nr:hypothetical protein TNCT6_68220 [Streptomyces sp. 6-11-2]
MAKSSAPITLGTVQAGSGKGMTARSSVVRLTPRCRAAARRLPTRPRESDGNSLQNPLGGKFAVVSLRVRRFVCAEESCKRKTFAERGPGLTRRFGRRTERLRSTLASVGLGLAGRAAAG